jgi:hypothetical protein
MGGKARTRLGDLGECRGLCRGGSGWGRGVSDGRAAMSWRADTTITPVEAGEGVTEAMTPAVSVEFDEFIRLPATTLTLKFNGCLLDRLALFEALAVPATTPAVEIQWVFARSAGSLRSPCSPIEVSEAALHVMIWSNSIRYIPSSLELCGSGEDKSQACDTDVLNGTPRRLLIFLKLPLPLLSRHA